MEGKMIKLIVVVKRKADMDTHEFHDYWRNTHANLIKSTPICLKYIRKYVQCHTVSEEYKLGEVSYDGTAELWFDSMEDKDTFFQDPEYLGKIRPDELEFLDLTKTKFFVTREEPIIL